MSHTTHANLTADDRAERRARRQPRPPARRTATRSTIIARELKEADDAARTVAQFGQGIAYGVTYTA
jgi:hypothetical protein